MKRRRLPKPSRAARSLGARPGRGAPTGSRGDEVPHSNAFALQEAELAATAADRTEHGVEQSRSDHRHQGTPRVRAAALPSRDRSDHFFQTELSTGKTSSIDRSSSPDTIDPAEAAPPGLEPLERSFGERPADTASAEAESGTPLLMAAATRATDTSKK